MRVFVFMELDGEEVQLNCDHISRIYKGKNKIVCSDGGVIRASSLDIDRLIAHIDKMGSVEMSYA